MLCVLGLGPPLRGTGAAPGDSVFWRMCDTSLRDVWRICVRTGDGFTDRRGQTTDE